LIDGGYDGLPPQHRGGAHLLNCRDQAVHLEARSVVEPDVTMVPRRFPEFAAMRASTPYNREGLKLVQ
jgi:hypothetical protein